MQRYLVILILGYVITTETFSWSLSAMINGGYASGNITTPSGNAKIKLENNFSDVFKASLQGGYFLNDVIYDGNGNHAFINVVRATAKLTYMPNDNWDFLIIPDFSFATDFIRPGVSLEGKYYGKSFLVEGYAGYSYKNYTYPTGNINVTIHNPLAGMYFTYYLSPTVDLNFSGSYSLKNISTSGDFSEGIITAGLAWYPDKVFSLGGNLSGGIDSGGYTMLGADLNLGVTLLSAVTLSLEGYYNYYTSQSTTQTTTQTTLAAPRSKGSPGGGGGNTGGGGTTPGAGTGKSLYSANPTFQEIYVSAGAKYKFSIPEKTKSNKK